MLCLLPVSKLAEPWKICKMLLFAIILTVLLCGIDATIEVYDKSGRKIDSFSDQEAAFDDAFITMEGYIESAKPADACAEISPPSFLTNFTQSKFVLINATNLCGLTTKIRNAQNAGYDLAVFYDPFPIYSPYHKVHNVTLVKITIDIQAVFVTYDDGIYIRENYVYNRSQGFNHRLKIKANTADITYYIYLFAGVIGICFFVMLIFMIILLAKCIEERRKSRRNRLTRSQLRQIPTAKFTKGDPYVVCAICLEDYNEGEKLRILPCSHAYHTKCVDPWLLNNRRNCPLCKRKITFGDSESETESEDSEMTSPAENTPLIPDTSRPPTWGTFHQDIVPQPGRHEDQDPGPSSAPDDTQETGRLQRLFDMLGVRTRDYRRFEDGPSTSQSRPENVHVNVAEADLHEDLDV